MEKTGNRIIASVRGGDLSSCIKKKQRAAFVTLCFSSGATGNRTRDTRIFSPLLYLLSYGTPFFDATKIDNFWLLQSKIHFPAKFRSVLNSGDGLQEQANSFNRAMFCPVVSILRSASSMSMPAVSSGLTHRAAWCSLRISSPSVHRHKKG